MNEKDLKIRKRSCRNHRTMHDRKSLSTIFIEDKAKLWIGIQLLRMNRINLKIKILLKDQLNEW